MIKIILEETYTKRDYSGNVYHTVKVINTKNYESFTTETPSMSNVTGIIRKALKLEWNEIYEVSKCTDSTRTSSLPEHLNLNSCHFEKGWKKELNKIGLRIKKENN